MNISIARRAALALILMVTLTSACWTACAADQALNRDQALHSLTSKEPRARREATRALAKNGRMTDVAALVKVLRDEDEEIRALAETAIWAIWERSDDKEIDALYAKGIALMKLGAAGEAIKVFSSIISKKPEFAEGWNKRATIYYSIGEYDKSLRDCDEVIKRNPLHFGALSGYGMIYVERKQFERALDYFKRALAINPNMPGVAQSIELLEQHGAAQRKKFI